MPKEQSIKGHLIDQCYDSKQMRPNLGVEVRFTNGILEILIEGYGEHNALPGEGSPVWVECIEGKLKAVLAPDINSSELQTIDLEKAREDKREVDPKDIGLS